MSREELRALGYTEEQIEQIMKLHGLATQANNAELARLKGIETEYNNLKNQPSKPPAPEPPKPNPEDKDPELTKALKEIADLKAEMTRKDIAVYASSKGLSGEQAEKVLSAFANNLELAKGAIDSISQIISDADKAARDDEKKALLKGTPNPDGGKGTPEDNEPEDVKNAKLISFGNMAADEATKDYYVLK